jgi:hypothetical protein
LFAAACCGYNPAAAAASTVFFSLWIAAAAIQTAATVSACSQPNTPMHVDYIPFYWRRNKNNVVVLTIAIKVVAIRIILVTIMEVISVLYLIA